MFGGIAAVVFLIVTIQLSGTLLLISALGVVLMLVGAVLLALFSWSDRVIHLFNRIFNSKYLSRFTGGLMGKLEDYKQSAQRTRKAIPEIAGITLMCWILKGFEWFFLGF